MDSIDDKINFDWMEFIPILGIHKCLFINGKNKDYNYKGIGGWYQKYTENKTNEIIKVLESDYGNYEKKMEEVRKIEEKNGVFPLEIMIYIAYQVMVSTPIIVRLVEKF